MRTSLNLQTSQQLSISPQLQQAIRLLQLSSLELEQELKNVLEHNLLLEQVDPSETAKDSGMDYLQGLSSLSDYKKPLSNNALEQPQKNPELNLKQYVRQQMEILPLSVREWEIATALIDALSEEGYLHNTLQAIQKGLSIPVDVHEIAKVLKQIQQCEPLGVGARTLAECLKIQLEALPQSTPWRHEATKLVDKHLEVLAKRDFGHLRQVLCLDEPSLEAVIRLLRSLNPKPGHQIDNQEPGYLVPDLLMRQRHGRRVVELNREFIPRLRINADYSKLLNTSKTQGPHVQTFKTHLKEAHWFLKGLKTRYETLTKVASYIVEHQSDFFEKGLEAMKPLSLQTVAQALSLHESTISRITTQKYMMSPRGILELKYFFSSAIPSKEGASRSGTAIRALIKRLIAEESCADPLSDQKIKDLLANMSIHIARRTVTKYRECMKIPGSQERRTMGSF